MTEQPTFSRSMTGDDWTRTSTIGAGNKLKLMLISAQIKGIEKIKRHEGATLYVVCKRGSEEWRSKPAEVAGFDPTWKMQQCVLTYKETKNLIYIEIKDKDKPAARALAECNAPISHFLEQPEGHITIPLFNDSILLGKIVFETFCEAGHEDIPVDPNFPHVKPMCKPCNNTHKNEAGTPL